MVKAKWMGFLLVSLLCISSAWFPASLCIPASQRAGTGLGCLSWDSTCLSTSFGGSLQFHPEPVSFPFINPFPHHSWILWCHFPVTTQDGSPQFLLWGHHFIGAHRSELNSTCPSLIPATFLSVPSVPSPWSNLPPQIPLPGVFIILFLLSRRLLSEGQNSTHHFRCS